MEAGSDGLWIVDGADALACWSDSIYLKYESILAGKVA